MRHHVLRLTVAGDTLRPVLLRLCERLTGQHSFPIGQFNTVPLHILVNKTCIVFTAEIVPDHIAERIVVKIRDVRDHQEAVGILLVQLVEDLLRHGHIGLQILIVIVDKQKLFRPRRGHGVEDRSERRVHCLRHGLHVAEGLGKLPERKRARRRSYRQEIQRTVKRRCIAKMHICA